MTFLVFQLANKIIQTTNEFDLIHCAAIFVLGGGWTVLLLFVDVVVVVVVVCLCFWLSWLPCRAVRVGVIASHSARVSAVGCSPAPPPPPPPPTPTRVWCGSSLHFSLLCVCLSVCVWNGRPKIHDDDDDDLVFLSFFASCENKKEIGLYTFNVSFVF